MTADAAVVKGFFHALGVLRAGDGLEGVRSAVFVADCTVLAFGQHLLGMLVVQKHGGRHLQRLEPGYSLDPDDIGTADFPNRGR